MKRAFSLHPAAVAATVLLAGGIVWAAPAAPPADQGAEAAARSSRLAGLRAAREGRWKEARPELERSLRAEGNQPEVRYALAVCLTRDGDLQSGLNQLVAALQAGFQDYRLLETDPGLAALRSAPAFQQLLAAIEARREASDSRLEASVRESCRETPYRVRRFASPRIVLVSDLEEPLADHVAAALAAQEARHREGLFPNGMRHAILVQAVRPPDGAAGRLPGLFNPGTRTLHVNVSAPAGTMLRELARALHYDDQAAYGQIHSAWLREGIAALYEQASPGTGAVRGLPDWRLAGLKSSLGTPAYVPLPRLMGLKGGEFEKQAVAEARYLLFWLQEKGQLVPFYRAYVERHEEDPTGRLALESVLGRSTAEVEKEWVQYLRSGEDRGW